MLQLIILALIVALCVPTCTCSVQDAALSQGHAPADKTNACDSGYTTWMKDLYARYRRMRAAAPDGVSEASVDSDLAGYEPQDLNDVLDLRLDDEDVLEATFGSETKSDDEFYHEHVSGGRMVREDLMVLHLRARRRKAMEHQHQVHHDRMDTHRSFAQAESARFKVSRPIRTLWQQWWRWATRSAAYLVDVLAFLVLIVVPWRMMLEMRDWDRVGRTRRRR